MEVKTNGPQDTNQKSEGWKYNYSDYSNENSATASMNCKKSESKDITVSRRSDKTLTPTGDSPNSSTLSQSSMPKINPELVGNVTGRSSSLLLDPRPLPKIDSTSVSLTKEMTSSGTTSTTERDHVSSKTERKPSTPSVSAYETPEISVYITDLPLDKEDDHQLTNLVRRRLESILKGELSHIKCYSKLGIGIVHVSNNQQKNYLISDLGRVPLESKGKDMMLFTDTLQLVSYVVVNVTEGKSNLTLPTPDEICRRWMELHKGKKPLACEQLHVQFPNIYRIVSTSVDELLKSIRDPHLVIKDQSAQIYASASCSFLTDLPHSITTAQLKASIINAIKTLNIPSSFIYIQINKQHSSACVLTTDSARKWTTIDHLYLDGKSISRKDNLTCHLVIYPVPPTLPIETIVNHPNFGGKVISYKRSAEKLILELSDKNIYDDCVIRGDLRVNNEHRLHVEATSVSKIPDEREIDADTWYKTEMSKYESDIMQFITNPEHPIFHYKWNSNLWSEQFQQTKNSKDSDGSSKAALNQRRHELQVTVMLNTLGVIHKERYSVRGREVKLNLDKNLKTIVYNHQSRLEQGKRMSLKSTPYRRTKVSVVEKDCIAVYEDLVNNGKQPVLLNMASATSPGGGFRKGDGAQEENLFRRSDYFRSLDIGLDDFLSERPERFHCSSNGRLESFSDPKSMYPMDEYGAIYTSGLTFFRHSEDVGYEFMEKPLKNVCSIAMAAYRNPELEGNWLGAKHAVGTRKKIENIFSIAYHHKHDSMVLSAFGCGAFRNPPVHMAKLFLSVIDQYAGFFDLIVFAIIDDHNAGQRLNPYGNFRPFEELLDGRTLEPVAPVNTPNIMFGPYRLSSDGSTVCDVCILDLTPCNLGTKCKDRNNPNHTRQFSHPPFCTLAAIPGRCNLKDDMVHMASFLHRSQCQYGGECRQIDDKMHSEEFEHPSYCEKGGKCQNMDEDHLKQYRHLPLCGDGVTCMHYLKHIPKHCEAFRHCQPHCPYGNHCSDFRDREHIKKLQHPFAEVCPKTPFHCPFYIKLSEATNIHTLSEDIHRHCLNLAHVCRFGRACNDSTRLHWEKSIHIARHFCPDGDKCRKLNQEEHLNSFTHPNIDDIRRVCKYGEKCHDGDKWDHVIKFRHPLSTEESGVVRYDGLNNNVNFVRNQSDSIARILNYIKTHNWTPLPSGRIPDHILNWVRTVRPVHRCNPIILESILLHGHVMSRDYMEHLKKPKFVANSVMQHSRVRRIKNLDIPQYADHAREYITALVIAEYEKAGFPKPEALVGGTALPLPPHPPSKSNSNTIKEKENILLSTLPSNDLNALKTKAIEIAEASIKLHSNPAGIGYPTDKDLGTDKHIFSILGPHLGHYYGDVFIVFKREILHHPDADFSIQAATSFVSENVYKLRPWLGTDPTEIPKRIKFYHNSKLHASIPGYDHAIALELMAVTSQHLKLKSMDVDLKKIFSRWLQTDSHQNIEAHLPQLIPLDYIDHIYIPRNLYDSLNAVTHRSIDAVFKHNITITPHQGDGGHLVGTFGPLPSTKQRAEYQKYVVDDCLKRMYQDIQNGPARPVRGAVITIPGNNFDGSFVLPLTISQAYEQYRIDHKKFPTQYEVYIYWQIRKWRYDVSLIR